jgi:endonuclease/exonuclease/phosphatase family metal-dependent hydrolase
MENPMVSLTTFNANNFFLRYRFPNTYPGDTSKKSLVEAGEIGLVGYFPGLSFGEFPESYIVWDEDRRKLAALALHEPDNQLPDIICFQEVENIQAIRVFNSRYLGGFYPFSLLIDSYDTRNIDVGILSQFEITRIVSYIDELDQQGNRIFSRDCLEVDITLPDSQTLTLFVNHLKSKYVRRKPNESDSNYNDRVKVSHQKRLAQAQWVADLVEKRFAGNHDTALYAVVGDFNDTVESPWIAPLVGSPRLTNIIEKNRTIDDRWTYYWRSKNQVSQIDYFLTSDALTDRIDNVTTADPQKKPHIERQGIAFREISQSNGLVLPKESNLIFFEPDPVTIQPPVTTPSKKVDFRFSRYPEVLADWHRNISDHCPVKIWF